MDENRRDSIAATLLAYYEFLVAFYLPDGAIQRPPAGGWPQVTPHAALFRHCEKNDKVIDLLKHIPCIGGKNNEECQIAERCICNDYSGDLDICSEAPDEILERCQTSNSNIATIAKGAGRDGWWILYDVEDNCFWMCNFMSEEVQPYADADALFGKLKSEFCSLVLYPLDTGDVWRDETGPEEDIKDAFQEHGWPTANYRKEEALAEVQAVQERWMENM